MFSFRLRRNAEQGPNSTNAICVRQILQRSTILEVTYHCFIFGVSAHDLKQIIWSRITRFEITAAREVPEKEREKDSIVARAAPPAKVSLNPLWYWFVGVNLLKRNPNILTFKIWSRCHAISSTSLPAHPCPVEPFPTTSHTQYLCQRFQSNDANFFDRVAAGRFLYQAVTRIFRRAKSRLAYPLNSGVKQYYSVHTFRAMAHLDLWWLCHSTSTRRIPVPKPTLHHCMGHSRHHSSYRHYFHPTHISAIRLHFRSAPSAWQSFISPPQLCPLGLRMVLFHFSVHRIRRYVPFLLLSFFPLTLLSIWAVTNKDQDYINSEGLRRTVDPAHRRWNVRSSILLRCTRRR